MIKPTIFLAAALTAVMPSWAINKCIGPDGKVAFQDAPCAGQGQKIDVKPASGNAPKSINAATASGPAVAPATAAAPAPAKKKEGAFGESWQRRTFLENRGVPDAEAAVYAHRKSCEQKQADLRSRQGYANNNLAGATYLQSLAAEMQATATMCDVRSRELNAELDSMKKELRELQAQQ